MTQQGKPLPSDRRVCWAHSLLLFPILLSKQEEQSTSLGTGVGGHLPTALKKEEQGCQDEGVEPKGRSHHEQSVRDL